MRRLMLNALAVAVMVVTVAGCDKCGHPVHLNTPSLPASCGGGESAQ